MKNRFLCAFAAFLIAVSVPIQPTARAQIVSETMQILYRYNLNATSETFCNLGQEFSIPVRVADATSTTMTGTGAFTNVAVGDMIRGTDQPASGGETFTNSVVARASADSITINTALSGEVNPTLTSATIFARNISCGTGINSGAFPISKYGRTTIQIDITQMVLVTPGTSTVSTRLLCRTGNLSQWLQVYPVLTPPTVTASFVDLAVVGGWAKEVNGTYSQCRVGMKIVAADDAGDTGTNAEQVTITLRGSAIQ